MTSDTQPSAITLALAGWRDAWTCVTRMISVVGTALLLTLMLQIACQLLFGPPSATGFAIATVIWIAQSLVLAPLAIAVHRYLLLDQVTQRYALDFADRRFRRFFGLAVTIQALWLCVAIWFVLGHFIFGTPLFWGEPIAPGTEERFFWVFIGSLIGALVTGFVIGSMILSVAILFPAFAVDAPGAGWRHAADDSRGHIYRIFCAFALGLIPLSPLDIVAGLSLDSSDFGGAHLAIRMIGAVVRAVELVLLVAVFASIASRLYVTFGKRLRRAG